MRIFLALSVALAACDRGIGPKTRAVVASGLPSCPPPLPRNYARPLVLRLDRDRALFDEPFSAQTIVTAPQPSASIVVPRARMHATLRIGACAPTSVGTWDCAAATWLASTPVDLDARATDASVSLPAFTAPCATLMR